MISWTKSSLYYIPNSPASQRKQKEQEEKEYEEDVLGIGLEHADKFAKHLKKVFEDFLRLPDNYPAEIVEEVPDIMCSWQTLPYRRRSKRNEVFRRIS